MPVAGRDRSGALPAGVPRARSRVPGPRGQAGRAGIAGTVLILTLVLSAYVAMFQPKVIRKHARAIAIVALLLLMLLGHRGITHSLAACALVAFAALEAVSWTDQASVASSATRAGGPATSGASSVPSDSGSWQALRASARAASGRSAVRDRERMTTGLPGRPPDMPGPAENPPQG